MSDAIIKEGDQDAKGNAPAETESKGQKGGISTLFVCLGILAIGLSSVPDLYKQSVDVELEAGKLASTAKFSTTVSWKKDRILVGYSNDNGKTLALPDMKNNTASQCDKNKDFCSKDMAVLFWVLLALIGAANITANTAFGVEKRDPTEPGKMVGPVMAVAAAAVAIGFFISAVTLSKDASRNAHHDCETFTPKGFCYKKVETTWEGMYFFLIGVLILGANAVFSVGHATLGGTSNLGKSFGESVSNFGSRIANNKLQVMQFSSVLIALVLFAATDFNLHVTRAQNQPAACTGPSEYEYTFSSFDGTVTKTDNQDKPADMLEALRKIKQSERYGLSWRTRAPHFTEQYDSVVKLGTLKQRQFINSLTMDILESTKSRSKAANAAKELRNESAEVSYISFPMQLEYPSGAYFKPSKGSYPATTFAPCGTVGECDYAEDDCDNSDSKFVDYCDTGQTLGLNGTWSTTTIDIVRIVEYEVDSDDFKRNGNKNAQITVRAHSDDTTFAPYDQATTAEAGAAFTAAVMMAQQIDNTKDWETTADSIKELFLGSSLSRQRRTAAQLFLAVGQPDSQTCKGCSSTTDLMDHYKEYYSPVVRSGPPVDANGHSCLDVLSAKSEKTLILPKDDKKCEDLTECIRGFCHYTKQTGGNRIIIIAGTVNLFLTLVYLSATAHKYEAGIKAKIEWAIWGIASVCGIFFFAGICQFYAGVYGEGSKSLSSCRGSDFETFYTTHDKSGINGFAGSGEDNYNKTHKDELIAAITLTAVAVALHLHWAMKVFIVDK